MAHVTDCLSILIKSTMYVPDKTASDSHANPATSSPLKTATGSHHKSAIAMRHQDLSGQACAVGDISISNDQILASLRTGSHVSQGRGTLVANQNGVGLLAVSQNLPLDINGVDLSAFHGIGGDVGTMCYQVAAHHQFVDHTARLDAQGFSRKQYVDSLDQGVAYRPMGGDAFVNNDGTDRLAYLNANRAIPEGFDGIEADVPDGAIVLVKSPRSQAMRDDFLLRYKIVYRPEVDKSNPAGAIRTCSRSSR